jgi:hypothetical protein
MVIFRVGGGVIRVGQRLSPLALAVLSACAAAPATPAARTAPELVIPRLDRDAGAPPPSGDGALFAHPPTLVGSAWTVEQTAASRSPDPGGGGEQRSVYESKFRVEVLQVDGPLPSLVRLVVLRNVRTFQDQATPNAIDGRSFVIDAVSMSVRSEAGGSVGTLDREQLVDLVPELGRRSGVEQALPDAPLPIGGRADDLARALLRVLHPRSWNFRAGSAVLVRVEAGHAVFGVEIEGQADGLDGNGLRLDVHGEARIRLADSRLTYFALDGRYELPNAAATNPPGTFELRRTVTSESAARSDR